MDLDYEERDSDEDFHTYHDDDEPMSLSGSEDDEDDLIRDAKLQKNSIVNRPLKIATRKRARREPNEPPRPTGWISASRREDTDDEVEIVPKKTKLADLADRRIHSLPTTQKKEFTISSIEDVQIISDEDELEIVIDLSDEESSNSTRRPTPQPALRDPSSTLTSEPTSRDSPRFDCGDDLEGLILDSEDDSRPEPTSKPNGQLRRLKKSSQITSKPASTSSPKRREIVREKPKPKPVSVDREVDEFDWDDGGDDFVDGEVKFEKVIEQAGKVGTKLEKRLTKWHATWDASSNGNSDGNLNKIDMTSMIPQPPGLSRNLKDYQVAGLNWLRILHLENFNGILADEMGLGKTIQTISLLVWIHEMRQKQLEEQSKSSKSSTAKRSRPEGQEPQPVDDHLAFDDVYCDWPSLIVAPTSTIANWERELETWAPSLRVLVFNGSMREREEIKDEIKFYYKKHKEHSFDVMIASYQTVGGKTDGSFFKHGIRFNYMVVDEAQMLKGKNTNRYAQLMQIRSVRRLLLTGTPLQNNLSELQALLAFLMPTLFGDLNNFSLASKLAELKKQGKKVIESDYVHKLKSLLRPFILRRLKSQVGLGLLPKIHEVIYITPPEVQLATAQRIVTTSKFMLRSSSASKPIILDEDDSNAKNINYDAISDNAYSEKSNSGEQEANDIGTPLANLLMQLRKSANHPILLRSFYNDSDILEIAQVMYERDPAKFSRFEVSDVVDYLIPKSDYELHLITKEFPSVLKHLSLSDAQLFESSGKLNTLRELLPRLHSQGHRVVLFSQFTTVLDLMELFLKQDFLKHLKYKRMDGSTAQVDRQVIMDEFNQNPEEYFIFLASTLAGGLGVNLTSADTVIFFDMSFNPQVDRQAEDRCHRLGQEKQVTVYNLIMPNSVETYMHEMAVAKTELSSVILGEVGFSKSSSKAKSSKEQSTRSKAGSKRAKSLEETAAGDEGDSTSSTLEAQSDKAIEKSFMQQIAIRMGLLEDTK